MANIVLCLGSNEQAMVQMNRARYLLREAFPGIVFTHEMETEPIGICSAPFINCMAKASTPLDYEKTRQRLKQIEAQCGDSPELRRQRIVRMDIDLLQLGRKRLKPNDWQRPYVAELYQELKTITTK